MSDLVVAAVSPERDVSIVIVVYLLSLFGEELRERTDSPVVDGFVRWS